MNGKNRLCTLDLLDAAPLARPAICPTRQRLARAFSRLQNIGMVRNHREDPTFEKAAEERIIWRELLEMELQHVDEQMERIGGGAQICE